MKSLQWLLQQNSNNGTTSQDSEDGEKPHKAPYEQLQEINDSWERENPSSRDELPLMGYPIPNGHP